MKVIAARDVSTIPVEAVRPGHIVLQGIVLATTTEDLRGAGWLECPTSSVYVEPGQLVQVFGKVTDQMVKDIIEAVRAVTA